MKYIVMECHGGYAVLMDEAARFVKAANIHYEVGQTVTDPVLMEAEPEKAPSRNITVIRRFAAAAAGLALFAGAGYGYYYSNLKPHSTVVICSDADICLSLNRKGTVIRATSSDPAGNDILNEYDFKGKDKLEAAGDILEIEMSKGYISSGDTIRMYVSSESPDKSGDYKTELEDGIKGLDLKISVHEIGEKAAAPDPVPPEVQDHAAPDKTRKPAKPAETAGKPEPGKNSDSPAPPSPPDPPKDAPAAPDPAHADHPAPGHIKDTPAPAAPDRPAEENHPLPVEGERPAPEEQDANAPQPPAPAEENEERPEPPKPQEPEEPAEEGPAVKPHDVTPAPAAAIKDPPPPEPHDMPPVHTPPEPENNQSEPVIPEQPEQPPAPGSADPLP
jgi:hypothetical protein